MMPSPHERPSRTVLGLLLLACLVLITLDVRGGSHSPVEPLRSAVGQVFGPVETGAATAVRPFRAVGQFFHTNSGLRTQVAHLEAENQTLRGRVETAGLAKNQSAELRGLAATAKRTGYRLLPAHVVAMGPAQSFSRTVTIDAGTSSGVHPDMTVLNNDGLVGRVVRADAGTATVLLVVDRESVVGGRLGSSMEVGFVRGRGGLGGHPRLDLDLVDNSAVPSRNDVVVTWGSKNGAPYVSGIPIGRVVAVSSSPRQLSQHAVLESYVDFSALDLVGVVVDAPSKAGHR